MNAEHFEIVRRWRAGQSIRGIARELAITRSRVSKVIADHQQARIDGAPHPDLPRPAKPRGSQLDNFETFMKELLERYPRITAVRMHEELRAAGYSGGYTIVRDRLRRLRPAPVKPLVVRFETPPGLQAQMDWGSYELDFTVEGRRRVNLFSYILGYSRRQYLCFTEQQDFETTIRQHVRAFEHLSGAAATCLYDNMKVVVQRWEDDEPIYNTRFLAFAMHYGFQPQACRPRRPQTKGKVERPFHYVETNLLNGRTFHSLEHLNEVTRWWLANVADVRVHRETQKRPLDAHVQEQPHLLPLPVHHYDTAQVVYRIVSPEGFVAYRQNLYSVPWEYCGKTLPMRITDVQLAVYNQQVTEIARHELILAGQTGQQRCEAAHRPPRDQRLQLENLQQRFAELGETASQFLAGLLRKQRYGKHQALHVLLLLSVYDRQDVLTAMQRAVQYHAFSLSSLERILAAQATPKATWRNVSDDDQQLLRELGHSGSIPPRPTHEYQYLLELGDSDGQAPQDDSSGHTSATDQPASGDSENPADQQPGR